MSTDAGDHVARRIGTLAVSGHCHRCSLGDRLVVHGTTWCPREPALGWVDWNGAREEDGRICHFLAEWALSRPVVVGERVLIYSEWEPTEPNGHEMATWADVVELLPSGAVYVAEAAHTGPWPTITYGRTDA